MEEITSEVRAAFSAMGRKGGKMRAKKLSKKRRSEIARNAGSAPKKPRVTADLLAHLGSIASLGGKARAQALTTTRRSEIAREGNAARNQSLARRIKVAIGKRAANTRWERYRRSKEKS